MSRTTSDSEIERRGEAPAFQARRSGFPALARIKLPLAPQGTTDPGTADEPVPDNSASPTSERPAQRRLLAETGLSGKHVLCRFDGKAVVAGLAVGSDEIHASRRRRRRRTATRPQPFHRESEPDACSAGSEHQRADVVALAEPSKSGKICKQQPVPFAVERARSRRRAGRRPSSSVRPAIGTGLLCNSRSVSSCPAAALKMNRVLGRGAPTFR